MTLGEKRRRFSRMVVRLCLHVEMLGAGYALDFTKRCAECPVGHTNSVHKAGLALDLLLYDEQGNYLAETPLYALLHDYWDTLGGARRIEGDLNHFSLEHGGVR